MSRKIHITQRPSSRKVYSPGRIHPEIRVPMREIQLAPTRLSDGTLRQNPPVRLYDTSGPYTDPEVTVDLQRGLRKLRKPWISSRSRNLVTQLQLARAGIITPEMEFVAIRENLGCQEQGHGNHAGGNGIPSVITPEFVRQEVARGRAIIPSRSP